MADTYQMFKRTQVLSRASCDELIRVAEEADSWIDFRGDGGEASNGMGVHQHVYDIPEDELPALYKTMWNKMLVVNKAVWRFHINDWQQPLRIARYTPGLRHDWHVDYTKEDLSKLAVSIPLNDAYSGGELRVLEAGGVGRLGIGEGVWFPAYQGHCVTPVESGIRYVLLGWFTGPRFR